MTGVLDGMSCSAAATELGEEPEATAPQAVTWLGLVVPGAWARDALSLLPPALRAAVEATDGVRAVVLRPGPLTSPDVGLVLAGTVPGRTWLRYVADVDLAAAVEALTTDNGTMLTSLGAGRAPRLGRDVTRSAVLVCINGARDACCARLGRAAVQAITGRVGEPRRGPLRGMMREREPLADVWESSHLGGHRFAPTAALLPSGMVFGGLGPDPGALASAAGDVLEGRAVLDGYRGRSTYPPHAQAADVAVRRHLAVMGAHAGPDDVRVDGSEPLAGAQLPVPVPVPAGAVDVADRPTDGQLLSAHRVFLRHSGGRTFRVVVRQVRTAAERPASCGAEPTPVDAWVTEVHADAATGTYLPGI